MSLGPMQIALIVLLLLVLFGRGRISEMMGDFGKGISSFKKGLKDGESEASETPEAPQKIIDNSKTVGSDQIKETDKNAS